MLSEPVPRGGQPHPPATCLPTPKQVRADDFRRPPVECPKRLLADFRRQRDVQAVGEARRCLAIKLQSHFQSPFGLEAQLRRREQAGENLQDGVLVVSEAGTQYPLQLERHGNRNEQRLSVAHAPGDQPLGSGELPAVVLHDIHVRRAAPCARQFMYPIRYFRA